jgi:hypothetical protein
MDNPFVAIVLNKQLDCQYICNHIQNAINKLQATQPINDGNTVLMVSFKTIRDENTKTQQPPLLTHKEL